MSRGLIVSEGDDPLARPAGHHWNQALPSRTTVSAMSS